MRTPKAMGRQLELQWTEAMQWQDLPTPIRDRVRAILYNLPRQAAGDAAQEEGHEQQ